LLQKETLSGEEVDKIYQEYIEEKQKENKVD